MLSTIVVSLSQLILVNHGVNLLLNGHENIFYKLLGLLQLANSKVELFQSQRALLRHSQLRLLPRIIIMQVLLR